MRCGTIRSGFTLMEVMIAILVLAIALTATLSVTTYAISEGQQVIQQATAASTAKGVLAQAAWPTDDPDGDGYQDINNYQVKRETKVVSLPADPDDVSQTVPMTQVTVTVRSRGKDILVMSAYERSY